MNYTIAREILMSHADSLRQGYDVTDKMAVQYPELDSLLRLAQQLKGVLKVVPVSAEFATSLQQELMAEPFKVIDAPTEEESQQTGLIIGVAALASAATGVAVWAISRLMQPAEVVPVLIPSEP
ncbi:MAG: hypothetical protein ACPG8W_13800 [Candidatus Promineifilaceae bacterium]